MSLKKIEEFVTNIDDEEGRLYLKEMIRKK